MASADNLCKQFVSRSGLTNCRARSGSKQFDTLMVSLKEFFEKVNFEKKSADDKKAEKLPSRQRVKKQKQKWVKIDQVYKETITYTIEVHTVYSSFCL